TDLQFTASFHSSGALQLGDGSCNPTSLRNHDAIARKDRKCSLEINAISDYGLLRTHTIDHVQQYARARLDPVRSRWHWRRVFTFLESSLRLIGGRCRLSC